MNAVIGRYQGVHYCTLFFLAWEDKHIYPAHAQHLDLMKLRIRTQQTKNLNLHGHHFLIS